MVDSPPTLLDLTTNVVCEKFNTCRKFRLKDDNKPLKVFDKEIFLPPPIADNILTVLCEKKYLDDVTLSFFNASNCRLDNVKLPYIKTTNFEGLRVLKDHKIVSLEITDMKLCTINGIIRCLNEWSLQNMHSLVLTNCAFENQASYFELSKFKNLRELDMSYTDLNPDSLKLISIQFPNLEILDISKNNNIFNIDVLKRLKKLKSLSMHSQVIQSVKSTVNTILELVHLEYLDMSECKTLYLVDARETINILLDHPAGKLLSLRHLDISGFIDLELESVQRFLEKHPKLTFLGLMNTDACNFDIFTEEKIRENLIVTGTANLDQIRDTLTRAKGRFQTYETEVFVKTLISMHLLRQLPELKEPRPDLIEAIIPMFSMQCRHPQFQPNYLNSLISCLYYLTQEGFAQVKDKYLIKKAIHLLFDTMKKYPQNIMLHKEALRILSNNHILKNIPFDAYQCAQLMLNCMCEFYKDSEITVSSIFICSMLVDRIPIEQKSGLEKHPLYIIKLLDIIREKSASETVDNSLYFAVATLCGLTDLSPIICEILVKTNGMDIMTNVFYKFNDNDIKTKLLGLFINIAEISKLRNVFMNDKLISQIYILLSSTSTFESYLAAEIFASILNEGPTEWNKHKLKLEYDQVVDTLSKVILKWDDFEAVCGYRSLIPIFCLLESEYYPVQLWSVWAINHACTRNATRYCRLLITEKGFTKLRNLYFKPDTNVNVKNIIENIFNISRSKGFAQVL